MNDYHKDAAESYAMKSQAGGAGVGQQRLHNPPTPTDPASQRQQHAALCVLCERLNSYRSSLRDIADSILGAEPEAESAQAGIAGSTMPVGGTTADLVGAFENAGSLLQMIDRQIARLQRVSS